MRIIDCVQGSPEWFAARRGIVTASCADQIITPKTGKISASSKTYAYKLLAERLLNQPMVSEVETEWMTRGRDLEPIAVKQWEFVTEEEAVPVGFLLNDAGTIGASPDRLIKGKPAALEVKVPSPHVHLRYLLEGHDDKYRSQIQTQIMVGEFDFVSFYSYSDRMPAASITTPRDAAYIVLLKAAIDQFNEQLFDMERRAKELGVFQSYNESLTPTDVERSEELNRQFREDFGLTSFGEAK